MPHLHCRASCLLLTAVAMSAGTVHAAGAEAFAIDPVHTRVMFAIDHAGFSQALGTVSGSTGSLLFDPDDWRSARLDVSVPLTRLELGDARWNAATLGASLLDGERYPQARFVSSSVEPIEPPAVAGSMSGHEWDTTPQQDRPQPVQTPSGPSESAGPHARVCGELTLRDITRPLCMEVTFNALKRYPLPPFRRTAGFSATATLSRSEFGIDAWAAVIGDRVELRIEAEATRDSAAAAAFTATPDPSTSPMSDGPGSVESPADPPPAVATPTDVPPQPAATSADEQALP